MPHLNPYLHFDGDCEAAFDFYQSVFGGVFPVKMRFKDAPPEAKMSEKEAEKILHMSLPIGQGNILMGSDSPSAMGSVESGNNFSISVSAESEAEADSLFKGLSDGGKIMMPLQRTFWGAYFGMLSDQFGVGWMVSYDYSQK